MQCLLPPAISTCGLSSTHLHSWWKCCASVTVVLRPSGCFFKTSTPPPTRSKVTPPDPPSTCSAPATGKPLVVRESPNQKCITNSHTHTHKNDTKCTLDGYSIVIALAMVDASKCMVAESTFQSTCLHTVSNPHGEVQPANISTLDCQGPP